MKLKKVLKMFDYRISEGSKFLWQCFGNNVWTLDFNNPDDYRNSVSVVYDTITTKVYYMSFSCANAPDDGYFSWVDPEYEVAHRREEQKRGVEHNKYQCYSKNSFLTMAQEAYRGKTPDFDMHLDVDLKMTPEQEEELRLMAESKGITFDELINLALASVVNDLKNEQHE